MDEPTHHDDPDEERIRAKAYHLWEAEGRDHGRDRDHWELARELIAIEDSQRSTLRPAPTEAGEPVEEVIAVESLGDVPGLTDQGDTLLGPSREAEVEAGKAPDTPPTPEEREPRKSWASAPELAKASGKKDGSKKDGSKKDADRKASGKKEPEKPKSRKS